MEFLGIFSILSGEFPGWTFECLDKKKKVIKCLADNLKRQCYLMKMLTEQIFVF